MTAVTEINVVNKNSDPYQDIYLWLRFYIAWENRSFRSRSFKIPNLWCTAQIVHWLVTIARIRVDCTTSLSISVYSSGLPCTTGEMVKKDTVALGNIKTSSDGISAGHLLNVKSVWSRLEQKYKIKDLLHIQNAFQIKYLILTQKNACLQEGNYIFCEIYLNSRQGNSNDEDAHKRLAKKLSLSGWMYFSSKLIL